MCSQAAALPGISYFTLTSARRRKTHGGKATLVHVMKLGLTFLSFELLIVFGLLSLSIMGRVSNITVMVAAVLSTLLLAGTAAFVYIVGSQSRINHFFTGLTKALNRVILAGQTQSPRDNQYWPCSRVV